MHENKTIEEDVIDLKEIFKILFKRKLLISVITVIITSLAVVYAMIIPSTYTCGTKFAYESPSNSQVGGGLGALAAIAGIGGASNASDISNYLNDVIMSQKFLTPILDSNWKVLEHADSVAKLPQVWGMVIDSSKQYPERELKHSALKILRSKISFEHDKTTGLMTIVTTFSTPYLAFQINQYIIHNINLTTLNSVSAKSNQNRIFVEQQMASAKESLTQSEHELKRFRDKNVTLNSPSLMLQQARLQRELAIQQEIFLTLRKQYELAKIEEQKDIPVTTIIEEAYIPFEKSAPKRKLIAILGLIAGLLVGIVLAFFKEWYDINKDAVQSIVKAK